MTSHIEQHIYEIPEYLKWDIERKRNEITATNENDLEQEPYCSFFGCGKRLSLVESLCGDRCIRHEKVKMDIIKFLNV